MLYMVKLMRTSQYARAGEVLELVEDEEKVEEEYWWRNAIIAANESLARLPVEKPSNMISLCLPGCNVAPAPTPAPNPYVQYVPPLSPGE